MYMGELVRLVLVDLMRAELIFRGEEEDDDGSHLIFKPLTFPTKYISEILRYNVGISVFKWDGFHMGVGFSFRCGTCVVYFILLCACALDTNS